MGAALLVNVVGAAGGAVAAVPKAGLTREAVVIVVESGVSGGGWERGWEGEEGEEAPACLEVRWESAGNAARGGKLSSQPRVGGPGGALGAALKTLGVGAGRLVAAA